MSSSHRISRQSSLRPRSAVRGSASATALAGGLLGVIVNFSECLGRFRTICPVADLLGGVRPHRLGRRALPDARGAATSDLETPDRGRGIPQARRRRAAAPAEKQTSTIHAVLHQVLQDQPLIWASIDHRIRALSATDDLIARVDGSGCDIKDLLLLRTRTLRPCPLQSERRSTVSARQAGGQPGADLPRTGHQCRQIRRIFLAAGAAAGVVVGLGRSPQHHLGRDRRPSDRKCRGGRLWHPTAAIGTARRSMARPRSTSSRPVSTAPCSAACPAS